MSLFTKRYSPCLLTLPIVFPLRILLLDQDYSPYRLPHSPYQSHLQSQTAETTSEKFKITHLLLQDGFLRFVGVVNQFLDNFQFGSHFIFPPGRNDGSRYILIKEKQTPMFKIPLYPCHKSYQTCVGQKSERALLHIESFGVLPCVIRQHFTLKVLISTRENKCLSVNWVTR